VFESTAHGYDTADYFQVDRRLGDNSCLKDLIAHLHRNGMEVILDAVFNHVGRDFWAFRNVREARQASPYSRWFKGLDFSQPGPYRDGLSYEGWSGHFDLVKLDLANPAVKDHLLQAVDFWIREFGIDGLRLDAADCLDIPFLEELRGFCRSRRGDFWLVGEIVHGDYRRWANAGMLDSVTNYEVYKSLYSSHVDRNFFELAYALNRQFGPTGLYRGLPLYNFADNHDVDRVASRLNQPAHLHTLYCLLFTIPGVPSIYYGSEWGIAGKRTRTSDRDLRPALELPGMAGTAPHPELIQTITRLARIRHGSTALRQGDYQPLLVRHEQLAFSRQADQECMVILVNAADKPASFELKLAAGQGGRLLCGTLVDRLNPGETFPVVDGQAVIPVWPGWGRILSVQASFQEPFQGEKNSSRAS
jgi:glycosidase